MVRRELLSTLRGWRAFLLLLLFSGVTGAYVITAWPESLSDVTNISGINAASDVSRVIARNFSFGLLGAALLFVPAYAAGSLVSERERATFDFLSLSLIKPYGIVLAKLSNALGLFWLLLIGLAPFMSLVFFLIGVDLFEMGRALVIVVATSLTCASAGILCSAYFRKSFTAITAGYASVAAIFVGPLILVFVYFAAYYYFGSRLAFGGYIGVAARIFSPPYTLYISFSETLTPLQFWSGLAYQLVATAMCLCTASYFVGRPVATLKIEQEAPIDDQAVLELRRKRYPYYLIDPMRRKEIIEDGRNPMLVRELRWGLLNRGTRMVRVFYWSFVVYFFLGVIASTTGSAGTMLSWMLVQNAITVLMAPALMANALTKEYELRNLDMLRMTLLTPRQIILGKLFAGALSMSPALLAALISAVPVILLGVRNWDMIFAGYVTLFVGALLSLSIGLASSLMTKRTTAALAISYALTLIVFLGADLAFERGWFYFHQDLAAREIDSEELQLALSPVMALIRNTEDDRYHLAGVNLGPWAASMVIATAFGLSTISASVWVFRQYKMRDR